MVNLSEAMKEALSAAPTDVILYETLELVHPNFIDEDGNSDSIRVVYGSDDIYATLESGAPVRSGQTVKFTAYPFKLNFPPRDKKIPTEISISIDNVDRIILENIEKAVKGTDETQLIYREYLSNDLNGPQQDPPIQLVITSVEVDSFLIKAIAALPNFNNKVFPDAKYKIEDFPYLKE